MRAQTLCIEKLSLLLNTPDASKIFFFVAKGVSVETKTLDASEEGKFEILTNRNGA